jgi:nitroreductase
MLRRCFLKGAGAVTLLVAEGQIWRLADAGVPEIAEGPAFEAWKTWSQDARDGPLALVHAAILSSNAFNTQPWLFKVNASRIELYADKRRNLGAFDPYLREMFFSLGCALENLYRTALATGCRASLSLAPGKLALLSSHPESELAARVELFQGTPHPDELFDAIPHRHTNRNPFDAEREVPSKFVHSLTALAGGNTKVRLFLFTNESDRKAIADVIWDASERFLSDPDVRRGAQTWYRTTPEQVQRYRDGAYVGESRSQLRPDPPLSYRDLMRTGRLFGLIAVRDRYNRAQTISAGRVWQRAHLLATARGLAARPANGAVEIIDHERRLNLEPKTAAKLAQFTGDPSWQPTFMFYMGYPTVPAVASARRSIQEVLI